MQIQHRETYGYTDTAWQTALTSSFLKLTVTVYRLPSQPQSITTIHLYQIILLGDRSEQLSQGCYLKVQGRELNLQPLSQVQLSDYYLSMPHCVVKTTV